MTSPVREHMVAVEAEASSTMALSTMLPWSESEKDTPMRVLVVAPPGSAAAMMRLRRTSTPREETTAMPETIQSIDAVQPVPAATTLLPRSADPAPFETEMPELWV